MITVMMIPRMTTRVRASRHCYPHAAAAASASAAGRFRWFRTTTPSSSNNHNTDGSGSSSNSPGPDVEPKTAPAPAPQATSSPPFPWRSSPILLDRLQVPDNLSGSQVSRSPFHNTVREAFAAHKLQYGFLSIFLGTWKQELADDLGWAFQKGLAGLLSHVLSSEYLLFLSILFILLYTCNGCIHGWWCWLVTGESIFAFRVLATPYMTLQVELFVTRDLNIHAKQNLTFKFPFFRIFLLQFRWNRLIRARRVLKLIRRC